MVDENIGEQILLELKIMRIEQLHRFAKQDLREIEKDVSSLKRYEAFVSTWLNNY